MTDETNENASLSNHGSKLFIRSEVLAAISNLSMQNEPSKHEKAKQLKRLMGIPDQVSVQNVLLKELKRSNSPQTTRIIAEFLMELGNIEVVQTPLWDLIQDAKSSDDSKDAANLILRHLGDQTDPNIYLDYLDDPAGLISRETERLLEVSSRNPEALIDFIDFIFSLPAMEQVRLIESLHEDYTPEYLINIFIPMILAIPPAESMEKLLLLLGDIRDPQVALFLHDFASWFSISDKQKDEHIAKAWKKSTSKLKIAGVYREDGFEACRSQKEQKPHPVTETTQLYQCFATIPDGIGNQGLIVSRERENGDIAMISVATNDLHGIIDCFGFYELERPDFHKLTEKFHEESSKIQIPASYCLHKLRQAETINRRNRFRVPYEYSCWKVLLDDVIEEEKSFPELLTHCQEWANIRYSSMGANLYHHPDFCSWFLEEGDHPLVTNVMADVLTQSSLVLTQLENASQKDMPLEAIEGAFVEKMDSFAEGLMLQLLKGEWRGILAARLADSAYLLQAQRALTFSSLAATQVQVLMSYNTEDADCSSFLKQYGRRCIEEDLLRLRQEAVPFKNNALFTQVVERVINTWEL